MVCFCVGTMGILLLKELIDSITELHQISCRKDVKPDLVQRHCKTIDQVLEHLKPVCDEVAASDIALDQQLVSVFEELAAVANDARDLVTWHSIMSRIYSVS